MRRMLVLVAFLTLSGVLAGPAAAAVPSPYTFLDPVGSENVYRKNDIRSVRIVHGPTVTFTVRTREGVNPATHPTWRTRHTYINFSLQTTPGSGTYQWQLSMQGRSAGPPLPPVLRGDPVGAEFCPGQATFEYLSPNGYRFTVPRDCLNNPATIRVHALYAFRPAGSPLKEDHAPQRFSAAVSFAP